MLMAVFSGGTGLSELDGIHSERQVIMLHAVSVGEVVIKDGIFHGYSVSFSEKVVDTGLRVRRNEISEWKKLASTRAVCRCKGILRGNGKADCLGVVRIYEGFDGTDTSCTDAEIIQIKHKHKSFLCMTVRDGQNFVI